MMLAAQLTAALARTAGLPPRARADDVPLGDTRTPAAVLVAITHRAEPGLILTQRPDHMRAHAGQIAFPGGRIDAGDANAVAAALREAEEEIGLDPAQVRVIGTGHVYSTGTGYDITPVLALIPPDLPLRASADEVSDIFEVPLGHVLNPANHARRSGEWQGATRFYYEIAWQDKRIWGATASILVNLGARLDLAQA